jgi:flagellar M-ring protein FliF
MNLSESMTGVTEKPRQMWEEASQPQRIGAMAGGAVVLLALILGLMSLGSGGGNWDPAILYTELDYQEASQVTTRLDALGVPYRLAGDARTLLVPRDRQHELQLQLAGEGFPKSGRMGYEIFDENQMAMTDFLQKVNLRRALQEELERTLLSIDGVSDARVHLVIPEPSLFTEDEKPVTASVTLTLMGASRIKERQIDAIAHLMSASVEGLAIEDVVILDSKGQMLTEEKDPLTKAANRQFQLQQQVEKVLEKKVQSLLDEVIGKNTSRVRVSALLDFDRKTTETKTVDPGESQVVLSEETNEKTSAEQGDENQAVRNFELNRTIQSIIGSVGQINRLSMALTIDKTKVVVDPESEDFTIQERTDEEIQQLAALAERAIGMDPQRGDLVEVFSMPFDKTEELTQRRAEEALERKEFWTNVAVNIAKVLAIVAALITLRFIIQAIGRGVGVEEDPEVLGELSAEMEDEEFDRPETPHDIIVNRVQQMVRERPEDAAKLIRTMIIEENAN